MDNVMSLDTFKQIDIRTVSPENLIDINDVTVDITRPIEERVVEFVNKIGNPYCFRCGKLIVQVEHIKTEKTINDCLKEYLDGQVNCF